MEQLRDHPVIRSIERTGYPSWMKDEYDDGTVDFGWEDDDETTA